MSTRALAWVRVAWVAATLALTWLWRAEALALLVPLAFVGPLVREVVPPPDLDERQRLEDYRASHIALMTTFALLFLMVAKAQIVDGAGLTTELLVLIATPLVVRTGISLGRGLGARRAGLTIGSATGALWFGFAALSHGVSVATASESGVGLSVLAATAVARRWPRVGGAVLSGLGLALLGGMALPALGRGAWGPALTMTAALGAPAMVAGLLLVASGARATATRDDEFADLRRPAAK